MVVRHGRFPPFNLQLEGEGKWNSDGQWTWIRKWWHSNGHWSFMEAGPFLSVASTSEQATDVLAAECALR